MTTDTIYIPLHGSDIEVGKPLPWAVYDRDRQLILRQGLILETQAQLDAVLEKGPCREGHRSSASPHARHDGRGSGGSAATDAAGERIVSLRFRVDIRGIEFVTSVDATIRSVLSFRRQGSCRWQTGRPGRGRRSWRRRELCPPPAAGRPRSPCRPPGWPLRC